MYTTLYESLKDIPSNQFSRSRRKLTVVQSHRLAQNSGRDFRLPSAKERVRLLALGLAFFRLQEYEKAADAFNKANLLHTDNEATLNNYGMIQGLLGNYSHGLATLEEVVQLNPSLVAA